MDRERYKLPVHIFYHIGIRHSWEVYIEVDLSNLFHLHTGKLMPFRHDIRPFDVVQIVSNIILGIIHVFVYVDMRCFVNLVCNCV